MNRFKKAISVGMSATLLASLFTVIAAGTASAATTVGSVGNVPVGGTSANTATFTFSEQAIASIATNAAGSFTVTIAPFAAGGAVTFSGTPSVAGSTGSLGASASVAGSVLTVNIAGSDTANQETIIVSGLKISAATATTLGAISATMGGFAGSITSAAQFAGGGTATGTLSIGYGAGTTSIIVNNTSPSCLFSSAGTLAFATSAESVALTTASGPNTPAAGQQTLTIAATANVHGANEVVSEATGCAASNTLASPGTVVAAVTYASAGNLTVFPGENNSLASNLTLLEPSTAFLAAASTFTFKILTPGVVFSSAPSIAGTNGIVLTAPVISIDRLSAVVTVTTVSTGPSLITLSNILYDVLGTVPAGTFISVGLTTSAAQAVLPATNTNAVVFRGITASAPSPTVYIGENNQTAGVITFTESQAGFFTAGVGTGTNVISICPAGVTYTFTLAPVAMVVGGTAAGNMILRDGAAASTTNIVPGISTAGNCYTWFVWTASTTASTIKIGAAPSAATGPLINVTAGQAPGAVLTNLNVGSTAVSATLFATVQFATAAYRNQVVVTALSQPTIPVGSNGSPAGNIQIDETATGQLKANEEICVEILPNQNAGILYDAFLKGLTTADVPVVTATNGVVTSPVSFSNERCQPGLALNPAQTLAISFSFIVMQQSTGGNGRLVISNIKYATVNDAVTGPVQVQVFGLGGIPTSVVFQSLISNAKIGVGIGGTNATRLGVTQTGAFTISTKVAAVRKYVTYRFDFGVAAAGQTFVIWGATKTGNDWSAFTAVTSRVANASGVVYYYIRQNSATWKSYRASWTGGGVLTLARQARWR